MDTLQPEVAVPDAVEAAQWCAHPPWLPVVLLHIPKTGGTTFRAICEQIFERDQIFVSHDVNEWKSLGSGIYRKRVIAGHLDLPSIEQLIDCTKVRLITFLRNPPERNLSVYYYLRAHTSEWVERNSSAPHIIANSATLREFLTADHWEVRSQVSNTMCGYLVGHDAPRRLDQATLADAAIKQLEKFDYVGVTESMEEALSEVFGRFFPDVVVPATAPHHENSRYTPDLDNRDLSHTVEQSQRIDEECCRLIRSLNEADVRLYNSVVESRHPQLKSFGLPASPAALALEPDPRFAAWLAQQLEWKLSASEAAIIKRDGMLARFKARLGTAEWVADRFNAEREQLVSAAAASDLAAASAEQARAAAEGKIADILAERDALAANKAQTAERLLAVEADVARLAAERDAITTSKAEAEERLAAVQADVARLAAERDAITTSKAEAEERLAAVQADVACLAAERDAITTSKAEAEERLAAVQADVACLAAERDALATAKAAAERRARALETDVARLASERDSLAAAKADLESAISNARTQSMHLVQASGRLSETNLALLRAIKREQELAAVAHGERDRLAAQLSALRSALAAAEARAAELGDKCGNIADDKEAVERKLLLAIAALADNGAVLEAYRKTVGGKPISWTQARRRLARLRNRALRERGRLACEERRWQEAVRLCHTLVARDPKDASGWIGYGDALKEAASFDRAAASYLKSLQFAPCRVETYLQLGRSFRMLGEMEAASRAFLQAFALQPTLPDVRRELATLGWDDAMLQCR